MNCAGQNNHEEASPMLLLVLVSKTYNNICAGNLNFLLYIHSGKLVTLKITHVSCHSCESGNKQT